MSRTIRVNPSPKADAFVWLTMAELTAPLVFFPYPPHFNGLPHDLGVQRVMWHDYAHAIVTSAPMPWGTPGRWRAKAAPPGA